MPTLLRPSQMDRYSGLIRHHKADDVAFPEVALEGPARVPVRALCELSIGQGFALPTGRQVRSGPLFGKCRNDAR